MTIKCPEGCILDSDTPFYYPPFTVGWTLGDKSLEPELGILADKNGNPVNMWVDETAGVPNIFMEACKGWPELPLCNTCGRQTEWVKGKV